MLAVSKTRDFKAQLDAALIELKSLHGGRVEKARQHLEELKQRQFKPSEHRVKDVEMILGVVDYVSASRTEDDIATVGMLATLAQYVCDLAESVEALRNVVSPELTTKVDALLPYLPPLTDLTNAIKRRVQRMKQEEETTRRFIKNLGGKSDRAK